MGKKRTTAQAEPSKVQNRDDLVSALARITELQQQRSAAVGETDTQIAVLMQGLGLVLLPIDAELKVLARDVQRFAEVHRLELTDNNKVKTVALETGDIGWRKDPPSVSVPTDAETLRHIVDALNAVDPALVRTTRAVDKDAILALRAAQANAEKDTELEASLTAKLDAVAGIEKLRINPGVEKFFINPKVMPVEPEHAGAGEAQQLDEVAA